MDRTFLLRFVETLETVIPPDGSLSLTNVIELWESTLPIDPHPNFFVVYLIGKYLLYETGLYKTTTIVEMIVKLTTAGLSAEEMRPVDDPDVAEIKKSLLNTILYVAVHYPPTYDRPDSPFSIAISNWVIISEKMFSGKLSHAAEFLQSVINQEADNQRLIWSVEKLIKIPHEECPESYLADDSSRVAPALLNAYLRETVLRDPEKVQVIFDAFAMFLAHPRTTRDEILPLLQMIYQFFHLIPVRHPETISTLYALIQNKYYLWPKPYSDLAKEVLGMLSIEHKTPGAAMRHQLIREIPAIIGQTPTGKERVVHVLFDTLSPKAHPLMEIIKYNNNLGENVDVSALQLAMLAGILEVELNMDTDSCGIEYLSAEKLAQYLPEALAILKEAVLMKEDDAANFKKRHLGNLKERIVGECVLNTNADSGSAKTTRIPPLKFELYPLEFDNCDPEVDVTPNSFPKFPRRNSCNTILFILNQYRQLKSKRPLTVRIGVVGTDYTLHNIAASYASLKSTHASLLDNLNVQFFYVPSEKSHLAEFVGRQDKWYGRNIVCMLDCYFHLFPSTSSKPSGLSPLSMGLLRQSPVVAKGGADKGKKVAKSKSTDKAEAPSPAQTKAKTWANNEAMDGALEEMQRRIAFKKLSEGSSSSVNLNVSPLVTSQPQLPSSSSSSSSSSSISGSGSGSGSGSSPAMGRLGGSGGQGNKMLPQKAPTAAQRREAAGASAAKKNVFEYLKLMYGAPERGMLPAFVLRTELEQFFRDARYTVPLTLYSCECWLDDTPYSSYTVPFLRTVELGIDALNRYLEDQGEEADPHKDIKLIAKQLPSFNLRCKQMSMDGVPRAVVVVQPKPWYSVIAASCPVIDDDRTEDANPVLPWLEMHTTELDSKKRRQSRVYHISEVIAESDKPRGKFSVLLDDVLYGPFYKISVTPCMIGETTVRLPLMSFLPF